MEQEIKTKAFYFGAKVRFNKDHATSFNLKEVEYCLIGFCDNFYALVEWEKRGQYKIEHFQGSVYIDLELVE